MSTITTPIPGGAVPAPWTAPVRSAAPSGSAITLGDIYRVLRERMFMVLGIWLLCIGLTVGVTAVVQYFWPLWPAQGYVKVESLQAKSPDDPLGNKSASNELGIERMLLDQSYLAVSPTVLDTTLRDPEVRVTAWYREADEKFKSNPSKRVNDQLKATINVTPVRRSSLLMVEVQTKDPKDAPILVNTLIEKYIDQADKISKDTYRLEEESRGRLLAGQKSALDANSRKMNQQLADYPYIQAMLSGGRTPVDDDVMFYNAMKNDYATQALTYKNSWDLLENLGPQAMQITDDLRVQVEDSPLIQDYRRRVAELEQAVEPLKARLGPNHREVRDYQKSIVETKTKLEDLRQETMDRLLLQQRDAARREYATAQQTLVRLEELYAESLARQADQQEKLKAYRDMEADQKILSEKVDDLNKDIEELGSVINRAKTVQITPLSQAIEPKQRSRPNWYVWIPSGIGLGLLLAVGLALLLEFTDTTVRTPRDVSRHVDLPILGLIPAAEDDEVEIDQIELATVKHGNSIVAEAFRNLRTSLFFAAPPERQQIIVVTSPSPEEGKTVIACNLASVIAKSRQRVLLIDGNFRRPMIRNFFPEAKPEGLSNVLIGHCRLEEVIVPTSVPGLDVMSAGPTPPNPAELLVGEHLPRLIEATRNLYEKIIVDGPPALLVSDAMVLAGAVDGLILVCRSRKTSRGAVLRARTQLESIGALILGAVLNAVQTTRGGYFRKQYRDYYDYSLEGEESQPQQLPPPADAPNEPPAIESDASGSAAPEVEKE